MAENSLVDIFDLCWNAILKESVDNSNTFFSEKHCSTDESRDTNFDLVENRLAYIYKFGCFNAILVQKCLESFLDKCSEGEKLFSRDLKVCSLSNGPGIDLIGLFCGIYKSNPNLKSLLVFKTINLYNSWWSICHTIFTKVFQAANESSNNSFNIPPEIIHFIQCDIYSTIPCDVEESIKDSDILLMVKVFASTKATSDVVIKSMKEIFSLLKPGSFVFFVGSKKNTKELTTHNLISKFVNCMFGPIKISVEDLPVNEAIVKNMTVKPRTSGSAYFIVWQKKDSISLESIPKKNRNRKKKKHIIQEQVELIENTALSKETYDINGSSDTLCSSDSKQSETLCDGFQSAPCETKFDSVPKKKRNRRKKKPIIQEQVEFIESTALSKETYDINGSSDSLCSSDSKQSETLCDGFQSASCETKFQPISPVEIHLQHLEEKKHNITVKNSLSVDSITTLINKINLDSEKGVTEIKDSSKSGKENICIPKEHSQARESESYIVKEEVITQTKNEDDLLNEINSCKQTEVEMVLNKVCKPESQLMEESNFSETPNIKPVLTNHPGKELHLVQKDAFPTEENTFILDNNNVTLISSNKKGSVQAMQFNQIVSSKEHISKLEKSIQAKKKVSHVVTQTDICSLNNILQKKSKTTANQVTDYLCLEKDICDEASSSNSSSRGNSVNHLEGRMFRTVIQNIDDEKLLPDSNFGIIKSKNRSKRPKNKSCENSLDLKSNKESTEINDRNKDLNILLQHCENLVTSLEKLTVNLKNSISSSNDQDTRCCSRKSCTNFKIQHACVNSCCFNPAYSDCCRKVCKCHVFHHTTCTTCPKYFCNRAEPK